MSWDIDLVDPVTKEVLRIDEPHFMRGGTYCVGGTDELSLNITYNYSIFYRREDTFGEKEGLNRLNGMLAADAIPLLEKAIANLGNETDTDYWKATEGNAKRALIQLLAMAKMRPDGIFDFG